MRLSASRLLSHPFILNNFQSPNPIPRPKNSNTEFPYDCEYLDRRPPQGKCYRVHFVDNFSYSGPAPIVAKCDQESDDEHAMGGSGKQQEWETLDKSNQETKSLGSKSGPLVAGLMNVKKGKKSEFQSCL